MSEHTQVLSSQTLNYSRYHGNRCLCQSTSELVGRRHEWLPWQHASLQQHLAVCAILLPERRNGYWGESSNFPGWEVGTQYLGPRQEFTALWASKGSLRKVSPKP